MQIMRSDLITIGELEVIVERVLYYEDHCSFDMELRFRDRIAHVTWMCSNDDLDIRNDLFSWLQVASAKRAPRVGVAGVDAMLLCNWRKTRRDALMLFGDEDTIQEYMDLCLAEV